MWLQKISIPPPKGSDFPGGRGVNLPNFPVGRAGGGGGGGGWGRPPGHHREIFPEGSHDA